MTKARRPTLFTRHPGNPILSPGDWPYRVNSVFNAAAAEVDGETLLLVRVEDFRGFSHLCVARSADGVSGWSIDPAPSFEPDPDSRPEDRWGVEDARITRIDERDQWAVTYTSYGKRGPLVSLATTTDFSDFERLGAVLPPENKDAAIFPERVGGRFAMLHRPVPGGAFGAHVWIAFSPDLVHWGDHRLVIPARAGGWWDANKIGICTPPIRVDAGWLVLYHGVRETVGGCIYRLGLALLDADDPARLVRRSDEWVFGPLEGYEREGDVDNVVFPCGWIVRGDEVSVYYGAADYCIALATASLAELTDYVTSCPGPAPAE